jgi:hypothetical protein
VPAEIRFAAQPLRRLPGQAEEGSFPSTGVKAVPAGDGQTLPAAQASDNPSSLSQPLDCSGIRTPSSITAVQISKSSSQPDGRALRLAPALRSGIEVAGPQTLTATAGRLLIATSPDAIMSNTANTNIKPLNPIGK